MYVLGRSRLSLSLSISLLYVGLTRSVSLLISVVSFFVFILCCSSLFCLATISPFRDAPHVTVGSPVTMDPVEFEKLVEKMKAFMVEHIYPNEMVHMHLLWLLACACLPSIDRSSMNSPNYPSIHRFHPSGERTISIFVLAGIPPPSGTNSASQRQRVGLASHLT